jgi:hypothetical protein
LASGVVIRSKSELSRGSQRCKDLTEDQKQIAVKQKHQGHSAESCKLASGRHVRRWAGWRRAAGLGLATVSLTQALFSLGAEGGGGESGKVGVAQRECTCPLPHDLYLVRVALFRFLLAGMCLGHVVSI